MIIKFPSGTVYEIHNSLNCQFLDALLEGEYKSEIVLYQFEDVFRCILNNTIKLEEWKG